MRSFRLESIRQAKELAKNSYLRYQETGTPDDEFRYVFPRVFSPIHKDFERCIEVISEKEYLMETCFHEVLKDLDKLVKRLEEVELSNLYQEIVQNIPKIDLSKPMIIDYSYQGDALSGRGAPNYEYLVEVDDLHRTVRVLRGYIKLVDGETHDIETE